MAETHDVNTVSGYLMAALEAGIDRARICQAVAQTVLHLNDAFPKQEAVRKAQERIWRTLVAREPDHSFHDELMATFYAWADAANKAWDRVEGAALASVMNDLQDVLWPYAPFGYMEESIGAVVPGRYPDDTLLALWRTGHEREARSAALDVVDECVRRIKERIAGADRSEVDRILEHLSFAIAEDGDVDAEDWQQLAEIVMGHYPPDVRAKADEVRRRYEDEAAE